ncbi:MAG: penicillin-binding protein 2 [Desulfovibrio sp.]|nr:penicillin-binding protein 2 [Desulfovibrio sp.]
MTTDKKKTDAPAPAWKRLFAKGEKGEPEKGEPKIRIRKETTERYQPPKWGLWMLQGFVLVFFCTFVSRFWFLQMHLGTDFARQAQENHWRQERISAPRGRIFDVKGRVLADNRTAYGLSLVRDDIKDLPATLAQVSQWTGVPLEQVQERYRQSKNKVKSFEPLLLVTDLDYSLVVRIESELYAWPGLEVVVLTKRSYPEQNLFAHILGYVAEANEAELAKDPELAMGDLVGKSGIEYTLDKRLRGRKGLYDIEVDASGHMLGQVLKEEPQHGEELRLSIDRDIQQACLNALSGEAGSVIVMEPDTGKLRAIVTTPSYDNNLFAAGISQRDWDALRNNPRFPLQNRVIQSTYPPGSVWKLMMAACFLENGVSPHDHAVCSGGIRLGKNVIHCWKRSGHGGQDMLHSIVNSCDVYYYRMAERVGIDAIAPFAKACGFGRPTGIDLPHEKSGLMPSREWKSRRFKRGWGRGDTYNASIGQGYVLATPLQVAVYVCALLNGGDLLKPQLVDTEPRTVTGRVPAKRSTLEFIVNAMRRTANGGTAKAVGRRDADMGGKTGTAQVVRLRSRGRALSWKERDHAWIATWGHKNDKTYVVVVMVEHGGGGGKVAGPVARKVYDYLFRNPEYTVAAKPQPDTPFVGPPLPPAMERARQREQEKVRHRHQLPR